MSLCQIRLGAVTSSSAVTLPFLPNQRSRGAWGALLPSLPRPLSLDKVNAAVNSLLAPGSATNSLTQTVITSHALTPVLLTPSPLPSTIHFWSTLSPIAPRSPAKLSFQDTTVPGYTVHRVLRDYHRCTVHRVHSTLRDTLTRDTLYTGHANRVHSAGTPQLRTYGTTSPRAHITEFHYQGHTPYHSRGTGTQYWTPGPRAPVTRVTTTAGNLRAHIYTIWYTGCTTGTTDGFWDCTRVPHTGEHPTGNSRPGTHSFHRTPRYTRYGVHGTRGHYWIVTVNGNCYRDTYQGLTPRRLSWVLSLGFLVWGQSFGVVRPLRFLGWSLGSESWDSWGQSWGRPWVPLRGGHRTLATTPRAGP
ncbi:hypothetical protein PFLUV_G00168990 [Perca fluviatilis]|uniref:Uncharacterized protein n=1 Tax=Perca fluviatilis TaxID=8168 RepID=A0A6A5EXM5_PERFL|nr:hypothetical protein PFLUV_G00168990 [Perca fluviatilis]